MAEAYRSITCRPLSGGEKAADQGYPDAQNNLGVLYNSGKGVPQSFAEAYFWQNLAAARASGARQTLFAKNRDESGSKLWLFARLRVQQRAAKWAADHPVPPRSHEPPEEKRGEYPVNSRKSLRRMAPGSLRLTSCL